MLIWNCKESKNSQFDPVFPNLCAGRFVNIGEYGISYLIFYILESLFKHFRYLCIYELPLLLLFWISQTLGTGLAKALDDYRIGSFHKFLNYVNSDT